MENIKRIQSVDILRGIVMVIMALDHTRDYFHEGGMTGDPTNLSTTTPLLFFTRWITHFCAPLFVFLSGTSIYLQSLRKTKKQLSIFLFTRGLWLIIAEITILNFGWSFDIHFSFFFLQVIWAIGASMILLSVLVFFNYYILAALGIIITVSHNLLDNYTFTDPTMDFAANMLLITEFDVFPVGDSKMMFAYAILPWTGIMLLGYALGKLYTSETPALFRKKTLLIMGGTMIVLFIIIRLLNVYGDPGAWNVQRSPAHTILSFLNTTKYPPSLLYTFMTIGPGLVLLASLENTPNRVTKALNTLGRVPFFYYLIHIYILHILCIGLYFAQGFTFADLYTKKMSFALFVPDKNFGLQLGYVYLVWIVCVMLCYFPSKWYNQYKCNHKRWWLSYI